MIVNTFAKYLTNVNVFMLVRPPELKRIFYDFKYLVEFIEVKNEDAIVKWAMAHHLRNIENQYLGGFVLENKGTGNHLGVKIRMATYVPNKWNTLDYINSRNKLSKKYAYLYFFVSLTHL